MTYDNEDRDRREWEEAQARIEEEMVADLVQGRVRKPARTHRRRERLSNEEYDRRRARYEDLRRFDRRVMPCFVAFLVIAALVSFVGFALTYDDYDDPERKACEFARMLEDPELVERRCP